MRTLKIITAAALISVSMSAFADGGKKMIKTATPVLGNPSEIVADDLLRVEAAFKFKNPAAITEEGLNEKVFQISYPEVVIGNPEDLRVENLVAERFRFRNPKAITEEGLNLRALALIHYPAPVIGNPAELETHEVKRLIAAR